MLHKSWSGKFKIPVLFNLCLVHQDQSGHFHLLWLISGNFFKGQPSSAYNKYWMKDTLLIDWINLIFIALTTTPIHDCLLVWNSGKFTVLPEFSSAGGALCQGKTNEINHMDSTVYRDILSCPHMDWCSSTLEIHQRNVFYSLAAFRSVWENVECKLRRITIRSVLDLRRAIRLPFRVTEIFDGR
jgi:hypothetical protein